MKTPRNKHGDALAPGFNEDITYQQGDRIKSISICGRGNPTFLSLDQSALHVFSRPPLDPDHIEVHHKKALNRPNFVSAVCHAVPAGSGAAAGIILAACLDCSLKVYAAEKLRLRSSMTWNCGIVTALLYNSKNDTIITAGAAGVKLWGSKADCEGYANEISLPASDRPWLSAAGEVVPWCYGRFQQAQELLTYQVPGLKTKLTAADMAVLDAGDITWVSNVQLLAQQQLLLVMSQADVYGYDAATGTRLYSWRALAQQPLVSMAFLSAQQQLVTAAREPTVAVWQLQQGGRLDRLHSLGRFAAGVHCVAPATSRPWLLSASLDGFVVAWSTDSWQQLFRMKLPEGVGSIQFYKPDHFLCLAGSTVKFFKLRQAAQPWTHPSCPLTSLAPVGHGLLMATFSDSSIRLLDASSTSTDRSALTTVPQLSSAGLLKAAADLAGGRLFALLTNGHVHVWELHLTRPPALQEAWTHLERERCCSMAFMQGASMDPAAAQNLGLSVREAAAAAGLEGAAAPATAEAGARCQIATEDHLFIGTAKGDVLVCDVSRQGLLVLRVPVLKLLPVSLLLLDAARNRLVVAGGDVVRVWDLASLTCIAELEASHQLLCGHVMDGVLLLGSSCGRCHMINLQTGRSVSAAAAVQSAAAASAGGWHGAPGSSYSSSSSSSGDHDGPVTCISGNSYLQHFVTCSRDGYVKLFGMDRRLRASIYLGAPLAAVAFLNDSGDLLVAPAGVAAAAGAAGALLMVRADSYAVTARSRRSELSTIFDDARAACTPATARKDSSSGSQQQQQQQEQQQQSTMESLQLASSSAVDPAEHRTATAEDLTSADSPYSGPSTRTAQTPAAAAAAGGSQSRLGLLQLAGSQTSPGPGSGNSLNLEPSMQPTVHIHSSSRPPVDLDETRAKAELARAMAAPRSPYRQNTISRAVQQQQQQGRGAVPCAAACTGAAQQAPAPDCRASAAAAAAAAAVGGKLGCITKAVAFDAVNVMPAVPIIPYAEAQQQQQQQLQGVEQQQGQQQPPRCSLPQLKQLPAAFTGLSLALGGSNLQHQLQQQQQQATPGGTPGFPAILAVRPGSGEGAAAAPAAASAASATPGALATRELSSHVAKAAGVNSRKKRYSSSASGTGSGSGHTGQLQTRFEFNLAAVQADKWRVAGLGRPGSGVRRQGSASAGSSSCSEDVCSSQDDDGSSSESGSQSSSCSDSGEGGRVAVIAATQQLAAASAYGTAAAAPSSSNIALTAASLEQHTAGCKAAARSSVPAAGEVVFQVGQLIVQVPTSTQQQQQCSTQPEQQSSSSNTRGTAAELPGASAGASAGVLAARRLLGLQPSMRSAVRVVQHPDAFLEDVPPAAELQQLLARYRAQVASGRGSGSRTAGKKGQCKEAKKTKEQAAAAAGAQGGTMLAAGTATDAAGDAKPKKRKKKSKGRKEKQQRQQPVYLSQMDHLLHTVSDPVALCELREAEAHEMRQAAAQKHWAAVPTVPAAASRAAGGASAGGGDSSSSRGRGVGGGCSQLERLLSTLNGKLAGENAAAAAAAAVPGETAGAQAGQR